MKTLFRKLKLLSTNNSLLRFYEPLIIAFLAIVLFASPVFFGPSGSQINWQHVFNIWLMLVPYVILYLINRFILLPYLLFKNRQLAFFLCAGILIVGMGFTANPYFDHRHNLELTLQKQGRLFNHPPELPLAPPSKPKMQPEMGMGKPPTKLGEPNDRLNIRPPMRAPKDLPPYLSFIVVGMLIVGFDTGLRLWVKWIHSEQQIAKAEKENIQSQLALLRTQVSPHFFMNTLNNIHALIAYDPEGAQSSIIHLSKLMRHLLYESEQSKIELTQEITFIKSYVDLMKIRFAQSVEIKLDFPSYTHQNKIPPLLFTSFIENAFKHGISYQEKSFVHIAFNISSKHLKMSIKNSNHSQKQVDGQHGLGIKNSRQRLNILYDDTYTLKLKETPKIYTVELNIPL